MHVPVGAPTTILVLVHLPEFDLSSYRTVHYLVGAPTVLQSTRTCTREYMYRAGMRIEGSSRQIWGRCSYRAIFTNHRACVTRFSEKACTMRRLARCASTLAFRRSGYAPVAKAPGAPYFITHDMCAPRASPTRFQDPSLNATLPDGILFDVGAMSRSIMPQQALQQVPLHNASHRTSPDHALSAWITDTSAPLLCYDNASDLASRLTGHPGEGYCLKVRAERDRCERNGINDLRCDSTKRKRKKKMNKHKIRKLRRKYRRRKRKPFT